MNNQKCKGNETGFHTCGLPIGGCGNTKSESASQPQYDAMAEFKKRIETGGTASRDEILGLVNEVQSFQHSESASQPQCVPENSIHADLIFNPESGAADFRFHIEQDSGGFLAGRRALCEW